MYEAGNHLLVCAEYSDPELHKHNAAHIMISLDDKIDIMTRSERKKCHGIVIPSGVEHTANTDKNKVLIFLFDNTTTIAKQIKNLAILSDEAVNEVIKAYYCFENGDKSNSCYREFIECVYKCANLSIVENIVLDNRIKSAITYIQSNLHEQITCSDVANHIFLSEGRFSHLFKEQVGTTFSAYLIYQRIMKTYAEIINGKSITDASIEAGFSSSTHFAETNKRIFGLSASTIKKDLIFYKIAEI